MRMACRPSQHSARYTEVIVLSGRASIDGTARAHLGFQVRKLFKSATAHRPINKFDLTVMHVSVKKLEQLGSTNCVDQHCAVSDRTMFRRHTIAKTTDLETNHTRWTKGVEQRLGIGCVI